MERFREVKCVFPVCGVVPPAGSVSRGSVPLLGTNSLLFHHLSCGFRHRGNGIWGKLQVLSAEEWGSDSQHPFSKGCPAALSHAG